MGQGMRLLTLLVFFLVTGLVFGQGELSKVVPGHAHNDYENPRPLFEALSNGFISVEVDVFRRGDTLLVAHCLQEATSQKSLQSTYLDPLRNIILNNGNRVYQGYEGPFYLLIDIKTNADSAYNLLKEMLKPYKDILRYTYKNEIHEGPVTVLLSGNRPVELLLSDELKLMFLDGRLTDLERNLDHTCIPLVSVDYFRLFPDGNEDEISEQTADNLRNIVEQVHSHGSKIRIWGIPDTPGTWTLLLDMGCDLINTDNPGSFARYYLHRSP